MSALGRFRPASRKSSLPLKADFIADMLEVGLVPIDDMVTIRSDTNVFPQTRAYRSSENA